MRLAFGLPVAGAMLLTGCGTFSMQHEPKDGPHRVGFLTAGVDESYLAGLQQGLREHGWIEGENVVIERRQADTPAQLADLANELVQTRVDVIVTVTSEDTQAALQATRAIPIVMTSVSDAVASGFIASQAKPGGNVTGVTVSPGNQLATKRVELLRALRPGLSRIALLRDPGAPGTDLQAESSRAAAVAQGLAAEIYEAGTVDQITPAIERAARAGHEALVVIGGSFLSRNSELVASLALRYRMPSAFTQQRAVVLGGLLTYGTNSVELGRRTAYYVDRILRGAKAPDLPVETPTSYQFVINVKTAQALGITMPPDIAQQVTEWVQ
jgi:putative tryptophan/tyrosine transport system substrate-binding protein